MNDIINDINKLIAIVILCQVANLFMLSIILSAIDSNFKEIKQALLDNESETKLKP